MERFEEDVIQLANLGESGTYGGQRSESKVFSNRLISFQLEILYFISFSNRLISETIFSFSFQ